MLRPSAQALGTGGSPLLGHVDDPRVERERLGRMEPHGGQGGHRCEGTGHQRPAGHAPSALGTRRGAGNRSRTMVRSESWVNRMSSAPAPSPDMVVESGSGSRARQVQPGRRARRLAEPRPGRLTSRRRWGPWREPTPEDGVHLRGQPAEPRLEDLPYGGGERQVAGDPGGVEHPVPRLVRDASLGVEAEEQLGQEERVALGRGGQVGRCPVSLLRGAHIQGEVRASKTSSDERGTSSSEVNRPAAASVWSIRTAERSASPERQVTRVRTWPPAGYALGAGARRGSGGPPIGGRPPRGRGVPLRPPPRPGRGVPRPPPPRRASRRGSARSRCPGWGAGDGVRRGRRWPSPRRRGARRETWPARRRGREGGPARCPAPWRAPRRRRADGVAEELLDQAGLADPRGAEDGHGAGTAGEGAAPQRAQLGHLGGAPNEVEDGVGGRLSLRGAGDEGAPCCSQTAVQLVQYVRCRFVDGGPGAVQRRFGLVDEPETQEKLDALGVGALIEGRTSRARPSQARASSSRTASRS